ncbi:BOLA class I histocompatibility antigen, alpha chain BL3-7-like isoform X6 [Parambassis ranga]|uniref:BOLA class I histocompatibility antigen, alpha chain BL3-7-like isoform X6 n=1 Tax=Parambassis ranga TaxID=210632 RepID=A0A6P7HBP4_9TELE|nr:BOLA class I histocompatibility antigen, alpha chain BL3-7-like isoform X6 [Parambassis ranga]
MKVLMVLLLFSHCASADVPEYAAAAVIDGVMAAYYDNNMRAPAPRQEWFIDLMEDDPQHWERNVQDCMRYQQLFKDQTDSFKLSSDQTEGADIKQQVWGCEWDNETEKVAGHLRYGYKGEDFLIYDLKTDTWIAANPQAEVTKQKWDGNTASNAICCSGPNFIINVCPVWLKTFLNYGKSVLLRKDPPSVSLLQKTPSSAVSCHATGFYPDRALMFWSKDGEEIHEGVEHGEILPNHDGTFQMSVDLTVSSVEDWRRYHCEFQFDGAEDRIITELDGAAIRTNSIPPSEFPAGGFIGVVVGLLLLLLCMAALLLWKKNKNGFRAASTSESS